MPGGEGPVYVVVPCSSKQGGQGSLPLQGGPGVSGAPLGLAARGVARSPISAGRARHPHLDGCGARDPSLQQENLGIFLALWLWGAQVSALPREGLGFHHPTQAGSPYSARKGWGLIAPVKLGGGPVTFFLWAIMCQSGGDFSLCQVRLGSCCLA